MRRYDADTLTCTRMPNVTAAAIRISCGHTTWKPRSAELVGG